MFNFFFTAARLVALVPISSAMVERVFSQVKYIVETIGENALRKRPLKLVSWNESIGIKT